MDIYTTILLIFLVLFAAMFVIITGAFVVAVNGKEPRIKKGTTCEKCIYKRPAGEDTYKCTYYQEQDIMPFRAACKHYEEIETYQPAYKE